MTTSSTSRFSKTVENYILYRPGYPVALLSMIQEQLGLSTSDCIADIGSGTGKLTELLLRNGNPVFAVEPNADMRQAAERLLIGFGNFHSIDGTAEMTGLKDQSVGFITAAQAFHWFDHAPARQEFRRILQPDGWVLLLWNDRADERNLFMEHYNAFLQIYSTDLASIDHRHIREAQFRQFFGTADFGYWEYDFSQSFGFEGVKGRYLSCSYAFDEQHPLHGEAVQALEAIFQAYEKGGIVDIWYRTKVWYSRMV